jgi:hypothetical protein
VNAQFPGKTALVMLTSTVAIILLRLRCFGFSRIRSGTTISGEQCHRTVVKVGPEGTRAGQSFLDATDGTEPVNIVLGSFKAIKRGS